MLLAQHHWQNLVDVTSEMWRRLRAVIYVTSLTWRRLRDVGYVTTLMWRRGYDDLYVTSLMWRYVRDVISNDRHFSFQIRCRSDYYQLSSVGFHRINFTSGRNRPVHARNNRNRKLGHLRDPVRHHPRKLRNHSGTRSSWKRWDRLKQLSVCSSIHLSVCPFFCLFVHPSVCLSIHLSIYFSIHPICLFVYFIQLPACMSAHLFIHFFICLSVNTLFVHPSVCLSVNLSVCLSVRPSVCLSVRQSICSSIHLSIHPSIHLFVYPSVCLSICLSIHLFVYLTDCLSICLSIHLIVYPSVYLSNCLPIHLFIYPSVFPSFGLSIHPSIHSSVCPSIYNWMLEVMEQHLFLNVKNCLNANIYSYLEMSGGQSSSLYKMLLIFFSTPILIGHLWQLKTFIFLHWCLTCAVLLATSLFCLNEVFPGPGEFFLNFHGNKNLLPGSFLMSRASTIKPITMVMHATEY